MPKLKQPELKIWELFVEACGGKCCSCGKARALDRGHLHRHEAGGDCALDNLIPLCRSCNTKAKYGTKDMRPDGWQDRFMKLLGAELRLGLQFKKECPVYERSAQSKPGQNDGQVIENIKLLHWQNVEFVAANLLWAVSAVPRKSEQSTVTA